jgi:hypothetical protein
MPRPFTVRSKVEVAHCLPSKQGQPTPALMFLSVMQHMAALAQCSEVTVAIVGRIVIDVRAGQKHAGR